MAFAQRVVTWNVLSSALSLPKTFVQSDPKYLDANYRLRLVLPCLLSVTVAQRVIPLQVLERCKSYCDEEAIICLQEVSRDWKPELDQLFHSRGWCSSSHLYGPPFLHCVIVTLCQVRPA